ncbi:RNA polymerase sigma factor [Mariniphaga anaerophila]|nr:sigma-70 family RNA polymerase sigma factor [Mariniphaga anaerophila]
MRGSIGLTRKEEHNDDYSLWKKLTEGDDLAFFAVYDQYYDALYNYGIRFSRDTDMIKDCIHDLFLDLYKYRFRLSPTDNIRFYLFRSLRRLIHKQHGKIISVVEDENLLLQKDISVLAFEDVVIASETKDENQKILDEAMAELSDKQRESLSLKFEQNFSYKEIADILGISVESARTSVYRALKDLRKALKKKGISSFVLFLLLRNKNG